MYRHGFDGVVKAFARRECRVVVAWRWKIHAFVGRARADERLWWTPAVGTHEILVTDDRGLSSRRLLVVRARP